VTRSAIAGDSAVDFRPWLFSAALIALLADTLIVLVLNGAFRRRAFEARNTGFGSRSDIAHLRPVGRADSRSHRQFMPRTPSPAMSIFLRVSTGPGLPMSSPEMTRPTMSASSASTACLAISSAAPHWSLERRWALT
jgi:hypothetical protein